MAALKHLALMIARQLARAIAGLKTEALTSQRLAAAKKIRETVCTMDKEPLIKKLRAAHKALEIALEALAEGGVEGSEVGTCTYCGEPIFEADRTARGVHYRCYHKAMSRVNAGETTWEALEEAGIVQPASKGGRPKSPLPLEPIYEKLDEAAEKLKEKRKK